MPKAAQILAALQRDDWIEVRREGSHRRLSKGGIKKTWAFHDRHDLGKVEMAKIARQFGYSIDELWQL